MCTRAWLCVHTCVKVTAVFLDCFPLYSLRQKSLNLKLTDSFRLVASPWDPLLVRVSSTMLGLSLVPATLFSWCWELISCLHANTALHPLQAVLLPNSSFILHISQSLTTHICKLTSFHRRSHGRLWSSSNSGKVDGCQPGVKVQLGLFRVIRAVWDTHRGVFT